MDGLAGIPGDTIGCPDQGFTTRSKPPPAATGKAGMRFIRPSALSGAAPGRATAWARTGVVEFPVEALVGTGPEAELARREILRHPPADSRGILAFGPVGE